MTAGMLIHEVQNRSVYKQGEFIIVNGVPYIEKKLLEDQRLQVNHKKELSTQKAMMGAVVISNVTGGTQKLVVRGGKVIGKVRGIDASVRTISDIDRAKLSKWNYAPDDELYLANKDVFDNPKYYNQETGRINWPENDGFLNVPTRETLQPGTRIDRGGNPAGKYAAPDGTPNDARSLAPGTGANHSYEVVKPIEAMAGKTAPWFDQPGGGTQYKFNMTIKEMLKKGIITPAT